MSTGDVRVPRRLLVDVDGVLLIDRRTRPRHDGLLAGIPDWAGLPETGLAEIPPGQGARPIDAPTPNGDTFPAWYRPAAIAMLRRAHDAGVEVVWNTSWLAADPAHLDWLSTQLKAGFIRRPRPDELPVPPERTGLDGPPALVRQHWKIQHWASSLRTAETVVLDDQLRHSPTALFTGETLAHRPGWRRPRSWLGLDRQDAAAIRSWTDHGRLPQDTGR